MLHINFNRNLLAFVFIPVIQKEMDIFKETVWNSHRVRSQKNAQMPKGIPNHLYNFPNNYGAEDCGECVVLKSPNVWWILHEFVCVY